MYLGNISQSKHFNSVSVSSQSNPQYLGSSRVLTSVSWQMSLCRTKCLDSITTIMSYAVSLTLLHLKAALE